MQIHSCLTHNSKNLPEIVQYLSAGEQVVGHSYKQSQWAIQTLLTHATTWQSFNITLSERSQTPGVRIVRLHLYKVLEKTNLIFRDRKQNSACLDWGGGRVQEGCMKGLEGKWFSSCL